MTHPFFPDDSLTLAQRVCRHVQEGTHGRIRDLSVSEDQGRVIVAGRAPSHYLRQLALRAILELPSVDRVCVRIQVA
jgi:hypothetical protein